MSTQFVFHPIAIETRGPLNESAHDLLTGRRNAPLMTTECFLCFQRVPFVAQRFNGALLHDGRSGIQTSG